MAVRWAGRLLCWTLAAGMLTAAVQAGLRPGAGWWRALWTLPWWLAACSVMLWAGLRAAEKRRLRLARAADEGVPADYDRIA
ncbi:hypothetical protein [Streptomyces mangrovisoli]|uniref:Uncharacterized protein n=1 Tax=Streptomyces mangrovisoli TaxID=1428628 RepID=A0A1J4NXN1_9ACTN|nr:hypothetical protein [Streptomyces mangrovisoli]OIJ66244.1 hypothetical protein WN71_019570 [Streptomyces mangrovisoli]